MIEQPGKLNICQRIWTHAGGKEAGRVDSSSRVSAEGLHAAPAINCSTGQTPWQVHQQNILLKDLMLLL